MAVDFPSNPTTGQRFAYQGLTFEYDGEKWGVAGKDRVTVDSTAPSAPAVGDQWFNMGDGRMYVWVSQDVKWVDQTGAGGPTGREVLTGNRTYYVDSPTNSPSIGDDANDGLSATTPFATIQHAIDVVMDTIDLGGFDVTIQCADGDYTPAGAVACAVHGPWTGQGKVRVSGNTTTPANCTITLNTSGPRCFGVERGGKLEVEGFYLEALGSDGKCLSTGLDGYIKIVGNMDFGPAGAAHIESYYRGQIEIASSYSISGDAQAHWSAVSGGMVFDGWRTGLTITLTGSPVPNFSSGFVRTWGGDAYISLAGIGYGSPSFSGTATGKKFNISHGAVQTYYPDLNLLPGDQPGVIGSGGAYSYFAPRRRLTADEILYVRTGGSDDNDGGEDTDARAFATLQGAWDHVVNNYDPNNYNITISMQSGTYSSASEILLSGVPSGNFALTNWWGITVTSTSGTAVIEKTTAGDSVISVRSARAKFDGIKIGYSLNDQNCDGIRCFDGVALVENCTFDFGLGWLTRLTGSAYLSLEQGITIEAGTVGGLALAYGGNSYIDAYFSSLTANGGTVVWSNECVRVDGPSYLEGGGSTFTGTFTGQRYRTTRLAVIQTWGEGVNYWPGDVAGAEVEGGIYT